VAPAARSEIRSGLENSTSSSHAPTTGETGHAKHSQARAVGMRSRTIEIPTVVVVA
jgi:hypothetical protein